MCSLNGMNITKLLSEAGLFYRNFMFTYKTISLYPVLENIDWMDSFLKHPPVTVQKYAALTQII